MRSPLPPSDRTNAPASDALAASELRDAACEGLSRRELFERGLLGLLFAGGMAAWLSGCSSGNKGSGSRLAQLPNTRWPMEDVGKNQYKTIPDPLPKNNVVRPEPLDGMVIPRSQWAGGSPIVSRMNRADRAFYRITVHHDGTTAFTTTSRDAAARRLEQIRQAHLIRKGEPFGDIGYHYLIDPAGRVWQGRDTSWQGAHVAGQNPGNLGICMLGNYNMQQPNTAQRAALDRFVRSQMSYYGIGIGQVKTHQELAKTECPGRSLQMYMIDTRRVSMAATA